MISDSVCSFSFNKTHLEVLYKKIEECTYFLVVLFYIVIKVTIRIYFLQNPKRIISSRCKRILI